ncbi:MAG: hypothetical protein ACXWPM_13320, partial [Bdellovibrionota bacterium]
MSFRKALIGVATWLAGVPLVHGSDEVRVGLSGEYWSYAETLPPPARSAESGFVPSLAAAWLHSFGDPGLFFLGATADTTYFPTNYDGTVGPPSYAATTGTTLNYFLDTELDGGIRVWHLRFYTGLGFRLWSRGLSGPGNSSVGAYTENYYWLSVPVGARFAMDLGQRWGIEADVRLRMPIFSRITIGFSQLDPSASDATVALGLLPGVRAEVPVLFHFNPALDFIAAPWFEYSAIGQSATQTVV